MAKDQDVSGSHKNKHYGKVYVRRNRVDKTVDNQKANPDLPILQNSPSDPNLIINEECSKRCCDELLGDKSMGKHIGYKKSIPYPIYR